MKDPQNRPQPERLDHHEIEIGLRDSEPQQIQNQFNDSSDEESEEVPPQHHSIEHDQQQ